MSGNNWHITYFEPLIAGEKPFWPKYEEYDEGDKLREHREGKDRWSDFKNPYATKDQGQSK